MSVAGLGNSAHAQALKGDVYPVPARGDRVEKFILDLVAQTGSVEGVLARLEPYVTTRSTVNKRPNTRSGRGFLVKGPGAAVKDYKIVVEGRTNAKPIYATLYEHPKGVALTLRDARFDSVSHIELGHAPDGAMAVEVGTAWRGSYQNPFKYDGYEEHEGRFKRDDSGQMVRVDNRFFAS